MFRARQATAETERCSAEPQTTTQHDRRRTIYLTQKPVTSRRADARPVTSSALQCRCLLRCPECRREPTAASAPAQRIRHSINPLTPTVAIWVQL